MFADNLKRIRRNHNLSQESLADMLCISRQAISKWEQGTAYPEMETLIDLSNKLNVTTDELLKGTLISENEGAAHTKSAFSFKDVCSKSNQKRKMILLAAAIIAAAAAFIMILMIHGNMDTKTEVGFVLGTVIAKEHDELVVMCDRDTSAAGWHYRPEEQIYYVFRIDGNTEVADISGPNQQRLEGTPWAILSEIEIGTEVTVNWPVDKNRDPLSQGRNEPQDAEWAVNRTDVVASTIFLR